MKKSILTLVALGVAVSAIGQGVVNYSSRVLPDLLAHVYGPSAGENSQLSGNTASESPIGSQTYAGALLAGTGFSAELWAASGVLTDDGTLTAVPGSITSFRTGSVAGTIGVIGTLSVPQVALGGTGTFQLRAWDNVGGTITSFAAAANGVRGKSAIFTISPLGDNALILPADMSGLRSFNIYAVPEPSMVLLAGLGAASLLIFRRRK